MTARYRVALLRPGCEMQIVLRESNFANWHGINISRDEAKDLANTLACVADLGDALDKEKA
jgi:hypothetical protein